MTPPLLRITDLTLSLAGQRGEVQALRNLSLQLQPGEILGIVGESGSGKSTLALSILRLLPASARVLSGQIAWRGRDLLALPDAEMLRLRGAEIAMVFQDPMTALNPVLTIGQQMSDLLYRSPNLTRAERRKRLASALRRVGMPDPEAQLDRYPFQVSGGMRQRIAIAMAILQRPQLLIADEVTTALDATIEAQILALLRELAKEMGCAMIFISHNLGAIARIADRVAVLYAGELVETGPVATMLAAPRHPYARALLECDPARLPAGPADLPVIAGEVPDLVAPPRGCIFAPRCPQVTPRCRAERPALRAIAPDHDLRCHLLADEGGAE